MGLSKVMLPGIDLTNQREIAVKLISVYENSVFINYIGKKLPIELAMHLSACNSDKQTGPNYAGMHFFLLFI